MSAITCIYHRDGQPASRDALGRMLGSLAHRGPDGLAAWCAGAVGLGQALLHTTPEASAEVLPLFGAEGNLILAADMRLDNRERLIRLLDLGGPAAEIGDGAIVLAAYQRWGERCPEQLEGDFSFVIWDARQRQLFCARDHFGVRSFYYFLSAQLFACATEIKALLQLAELPRQLNEVRLGQLMTGQLDDLQATFYRQILRLPPAHTLTISADNVRLRRYWELQAGAELRLGSDEEYAEAFRAHFVEAVRRRVRGGVAAGAALSGGLDSSSIACTAQMLRTVEGGSAIHTFSAIFPGLPGEVLGRIDERHFVDAAVAQYRFKPHMLRADELSPLGELERMHEHLDEFVLAPNLYLHWAMFGAARREGLRVFLDGHDGDTVVSHGFEHLPTLLLRGRLGELRREARGLRRNSFLRWPARQIAWELGVLPLVPPLLARGWASLGGGAVADGPAGIIPIDRAFARRIGLTDQEMTDDSAGGWSPHNPRQTHARAISSPLMSYVFEIEDRAAGAWGIEPRYPFFDKALVELCTALPSGQKLKGGWTRSVLRRALEGILPREIQWRTGKADLGPNFDQGLCGADRALVERVLANPERIAPYVDLPALKANAARYLKDPFNPEFAETSVGVYGAVHLALWLQRSAF